MANEETQTRAARTKWTEKTGLACKSKQSENDTVVATTWQNNNGNYTATISYAFQRHLWWCMSFFEFLACNGDRCCTPKRWGQGRVQALQWHQLNPINQFRNGCFSGSASCSRQSKSFPSCWLENVPGGHLKGWIYWGLEGEGSLWHQFRMFKSTCKILYHLVSTCSNL
jgi:hypothetical protein